ncbi:hypothetical protein HSB1_41750 [Halogranum salarium B-1]|uniref:Uncharacterized protein n=1 Tax=Halogranum salarium B-1 TaxID=1210908 RepID=J3ETJ4_9EURY|nr:hypothetical protein HSB1_41750 [Halogranum salarium B-1]
MLPQRSRTVSEERGQFLDGVGLHFECSEDSVSYRPASCTVQDECLEGQHFTV